MVIAVLFGSLFLFIALSVPIGISIGLSTIITIMFAVDNLNLSTVIQKSFVALDSFPLMAIPFFIFAGILMGKGGISKRLLDFASSIIGFISGGLAMVTVLASMFFASISGSGPATVAAIGSTMIPEMHKKNYSLGFSAALTAAAGSLGAIIPPSISFILLGVTGGISIGSLFIAGVIPGVLIGFLIMLCAYVIVKIGNFEIETSSDKYQFSFGKLWTSFVNSFWGLLAPIIVLGGIYGGLFTPTEAAAIATLYAALVGFFIYKDLKLTDFYDSIKETLKITGAVLYMIGLSTTFAYILTIENVPGTVLQLLLEISSNKIVVLLLINLFLLIVGAFIDTVAAIVILTPILLPISQQIGMDPVHFGVMMVLNLTIGYITPPLGVNLFVASSIGKIQFEEVLKSVIPFFIVMVIGLLLVTYIPEISIWLPNVFNS